MSETNLRPTVYCCAKNSAAEKDALGYRRFGPFGLIRRDSHLANSGDPEIPSSTEEKGAKYSIVTQLKGAKYRAILSFQKHCLKHTRTNVLKCQGRGPDLYSSMRERGRHKFARRNAIAMQLFSSFRTHQGKLTLAEQRGSGDPQLLRVAEVRREQKTPAEWNNKEPASENLIETLFSSFRTHQDRFTPVEQRGFREAPAP
jgi:hypothetical protein